MSAAHVCAAPDRLTSGVAALADRPGNDRGCSEGRPARYRPVLVDGATMGPPEATAPTRSVSPGGGVTARSPSALVPTVDRRAERHRQLCATESPSPEAKRAVPAGPPPGAIGRSPWPFKHAHDSQKAIRPFAGPNLELDGEASDGPSGPT